MNTYNKKKRPYGRLFFLAVISALAGVSLYLYMHLHTDYHLVLIQANGKTQDIQTYSSLQKAKENMKMLDHNENENVMITTDDGTRVAMRYGVVNFRTKKCTVNTEYTIDDRKEKGYVNGCYGADGAYLDTSKDGKSIKFMQGGVEGWIHLKDVELLNYYNEKEVASVSHYVVDKNTFLHKGTTDVKKEDYAFSLDIGLPFKENAFTYYYSYDGHYFYPSFSSMIDDYQQATRENSVNKTPYYNYYQYLPHRSMTNYSAKDINNYIKDVLGYTALPKGYPMQEHTSMLVDSGRSFLEAQNKFSTNAILMMSLSINETAYGTSALAYEKNNLFGHAAYDASPSQSANRYANAAESIIVHASVFLNQGYLNACDGADTNIQCDASKANRYRGAYLGDKESGMNVRYASDPYWGEKAAAFYRRFDQAMGKKDAKIPYVVKDVTHTAIYQKPDKSATILYKTPDVKNYAFLILDTISNKQGTWYKIQSDAPIEDGKVKLDAQNYQRKQSIGYVFCDDIT